VTLLDWNTGKPNPRYRALQLVMGSLGSGDRLIGPPTNTQELFAQPVRKPDGSCLILLVNKTPHEVEVQISGVGSAPAMRLSRENHVDVTTGASVSQAAALNSDRILLHGFAVAIVSLKQ
jgi:hypothetical protein